MDESTKLLAEVHDLQQRLLETQAEADARNQRGLRLLMILVLPVTSLAILSAAVAALQLMHFGA